MAFLGIKDYNVNPEKLPVHLMFTNVIWLFSLVALICAVLFYFPIQEKLQGEVEISYQGIPMKIKCKQNGELNLFVNNGEKVSENQLLGLHNWDILYAEYVDLKELSKVYLDDKDSGSIQNLQRSLEIFRAKDIAFLQGEISAISSALELYQNSDPGRALQSFVAAQNERIKRLKNNKNISSSINENREIQNEMARQHIASDSLLLAEGIISTREFESNKRKYMEELLRIDEGALSIENAEESIQGISAAIEMEKHKMTLVNLELYKNLVNSLQDYKKVFFQILEEKKIEASVAGNVYYADALNFSKNVSQGVDILTIKPINQKSKRLARIKTGSENIGRVKRGDRVMILLDQYPIGKYGVIYANVRTRRLLPEENQYIFGLQLDKGLTTSYNIKIPPQPLLKGKGRILLNRSNIFQLIVEEFNARKEVLMAGQ